MRGMDRFDKRRWWDYLNVVADTRGDRGGTVVNLLAPELLFFFLNFSTPCI